MVNKACLVSWHKLDGTPCDAHQQNDGTWTGTPTYCCGVINNGADFSTPVKYITFANESNYDFDITSPFTIAAWIKANCQSCIDVIWAKRNNTFSQGYSMHIGNNGRIVFNIENCCSTEIEVTSDTCLDDGTFHHIVVTYSGNSCQGGMIFYTDGVARVPCVSPIIGTALTCLSFTIGAESDGGRSFDGSIDEISVWSRELTSCDVSDLYNCGCGITYEGVDNTIKTASSITAVVLTRGDTAVVNPRGDTARIYKRGDTAVVI